MKDVEVVLKGEYTQYLERTLQIIQNRLCGRIGGCLGRGCGCVKGKLDGNPTSEDRRMSAWTYVYNARIVTESIRQS